MKLVSVLLFVVFLFSSCVSFEVFETARTLDKDGIYLRANMSMVLDKIRIDSLTSLLSPQLEVGFGINDNTDIKFKYYGFYQFDIGVKRMLLGDKVSSKSIAIQTLFGLGFDRSNSFYANVKILKFGVPLYYTYFSNNASWTISPKYQLEYNVLESESNTLDHLYGIGLGWKYYLDYLSIGASVSAFSGDIEWEYNIYDPKIPYKRFVQLGFTIQLSL